MTNRTFECSDCGYVWRVAHGQPRPSVCPECESENIQRAEVDRSKGRDWKHGRGRKRDDEAYGDAE